LMAKTDEFVISVLVDESETARTRLAEAQTAAIGAEATLRGLQLAIIERANVARASGADPLPWLRAGELMAFAYGAMPRSELLNADVRLAIASWTSFLAALSSNPSAVAT